MFKVAVGHSDDIDPMDAMKETIEQCKVSLNGLIPQAGIFFTSLMNIEYEPILKEIDREFPGIELIGCTTDGEISSVLEYTEDSLALILFCSDEIKFAAGIGQNLSKDPVFAAKQAFETARDKTIQDAKICITLPDGISTFSTPSVEVLSEVMGKEIPIFGGTAGDQFQLKKTCQFYKTQVFSDSLPILLLCGNLKYSFAIASGWSPIGKKGKATKASKNIVYEIDEMDPLDFYKYYLGENVAGYNQLPLAVFEPGNENFYTRSPASYDEATGSMSFAGYVPENVTVQITEVGRDDIISAAHASSLQAIKGYPGTEPQAVFIFSCTSRKRILGTRTNGEFEALKSSPFKDVPFFGFYTYGEIGPFEKGEKSIYYSESIVILFIGIK